MEESLPELFASLCEALELQPGSLPLHRAWERVWRVLVELDSATAPTCLN